MVSSGFRFLMKSGIASDPVLNQLYYHLADPVVAELRLVEQASDIYSLIPSDERK